MPALFVLFFILIFANKVPWFSDYFFAVILGLIVTAFLSVMAFVKVYEKSSVEYSVGTIATLSMSLLSLLAFLVLDVEDQNLSLALFLSFSLFFIAAGYYVSQDLQRSKESSKLYPYGKF